MPTRSEDHHAAPEAALLIRRQHQNHAGGASLGSRLLLLLALVGFTVAGAPAHGAQFTRGDANADGATDVSDPVTILLFLFDGAIEQLQCEDAADVEAPGERILSTVDGGYSWFDGTSIATPQVAGVASCLLVIEPSLSTIDFRRAILKGRTHLDAFASALEIDVLKAGHDVLRTLLDIDDGTPDGNERITVPAAVLTRIRSFAFVVGPNDTIDHRDASRGLDPWGETSHHQ